MASMVGNKKFKSSDIQGSTKGLWLLYEPYVATDEVSVSEQKSPFQTLEMTSARNLKDGSPQIYGSYDLADII